MSKLNCPASLCVSNGEVFIADSSNHRVRKILQNGQIVTICGTGSDGYNGDDQPAIQAKLSWPTCVFVSSSNQVYISEGNQNRIRKIKQNGKITTVCGNGTAGFSGDGGLAVNAQLNGPRGLFVTEDEEVFIADSGNHRVRMIDRHGIISTIAGTVHGLDGDGGLAVNAKLNGPTGVFVYEREIYISDLGNERVRKVSPSGIITSVPCENVSPFTTVVFDGKMYITGFYSNEILKYDTDGTFKSIVGNGTSKSAKCSNHVDVSLSNPAGLWVDDAKIYIADFNNYRILKIDEFGKCTTIAGTNGQSGYAGDIPFDFDKYPHIGPRKKRQIKPFPKAYLDLAFSFNDSY